VMLNAAQIFGLADQLGTLEPGKIANVIVTNGDPLELQTQVRYLFIKGQLTSTDNKHRELYEQYRKRPQPAR
jgi:imidazolonepropionase-like amidohydrolase